MSPVRSARGDGGGARRSCAGMSEVDFGDTTWTRTNDDIQYINAWHDIPNVMYRNKKSVTRKDIEI